MKIIRPLKNPRALTCLHVIAVLFGFLTFNACAAEAEELSVTASGLRVVAPAAERVRAFESHAGTAVGLLVSSPQGGIVRFEAGDSSVSKFVDAAGNDLQSPAPLYKTGFSTFPRISADGKLCALEFAAPGVPAKGSAHLKIAGVVTVLLATRKNESVHKDVVLRGGTTLAEPNLPLKIVDVRRPEDIPPERLRENEKAPPREITFRSERDLDEIAEIRFFASDGKEIKSRSGGIAKMEVLGRLSVDWTYILEEPVDAATIKLYRWADMQKKRVPFALTVDVGL